MTTLTDAVEQATGQRQRSTADYARFCSSSRGKNLWASGRTLDIARGVYDGPYGARECGAALLANTNATKPITGIAHTRLLVRGHAGSGDRQRDAAGARIRGH